MPNENNFLRNSLAQYLLQQDFFAFGTIFAVSDLAWHLLWAFDVSRCPVRSYVKFGGPFFP